MLVEAILYIRIEALVEAAEVEKPVQKILKNFSKFLKNKDHTIKAMVSIRREFNFTGESGSQGLPAIMVMSR
ncbi:hypothetical protein L1887_47021 [Cichorium endivia]|nr:hypothetical protein L1887_47021 [Cichorium endivia]